MCNKGMWFRFFVTDVRFFISGECFKGICVSFFEKGECFFVFVERSFVIGERYLITFYGSAGVGCGCRVAGA